MAEWQPKRGFRLLRRLAPPAAMFVALALAACQAVLPGGPMPDLYTLTPKSTFNPDLPQVSWQLVVEEPLASGWLNTDRIALRASPTELDYYAQAQWTERAPRLVQTLLVESFENSRHIVAVGRQAIGLRSDFTLRSELREFQADYPPNGGNPTVRVRLNLKLIQDRTRSIIANETFEATAEATNATMSGIVAAFDDALGKVLRRTVEWTLTTANRAA